MKQFAAILLIALLYGCGVETATTAATAASEKKQEIEQGKKTMEHMKQDINKAMELTKQKAEQAEQAAQ
jgi:hypothetical protein